MTAWEKQLQRTNFKANNSTKVYSNHFAGGYRCDTCEKPILYMKGYPDEGNNVKAKENIDKKGKRKQHSKPDSEPSVKQCRDRSSRNSELSFPLSVEDDFTSATDLNFIFSRVLRFISIRSV